MPDYAYDFSIVPGPHPAVLARLGAKGILGYSFGARQSDEYLDRVRALGMTVVWIWERNTDSIFSLSGRQECLAHEARVKPGELTYVACDTRNPGDVTRFLREWSDTTREEVFGIYGPDFAIAQAQSSGTKCQRYWGVANWIVGGGPDNAPENIRYWESVGAHLVQLIGSDIADTDQNLILKPDWGTITSAPHPITPTEEDDGVISVQFKPGVDSHVWVDENHKIRFRNYTAGTAGKSIVVPARGEEDYKVIDPRPLVTTGAYGTLVAYAVEGGKEALISPTGLGPIVDII